MKKEEWGTSADSYIIQLRVLDSAVRYLSSQAQDQLPYNIPNVESNDQIFVGSDDFQRECSQLIDYCFDQILELIQKLDAVKEQYYTVLFNGCLDAANILIGTCNLNQKTTGFINKMFKMSDKYLVEHNKVAPAANQLSRVRINSSYEAFRKKKEQMKQPDKAPEPA